MNPNALDEMALSEATVFPLDGGYTPGDMHLRVTKVLPILRNMRELIAARGFGHGAWSVRKVLRRPVVDGAKVNRDQVNYSLPGAGIAAIRDVEPDVNLHDEAWDALCAQMVSVMVLSPVTPEPTRSCTMQERVAIAGQLMNQPGAAMQAWLVFNDTVVADKAQALLFMDVAITMHEKALRATKKHAN